MSQLNSAVRRFIRNSGISHAAQGNSAVRDLALSYFAGELVTDALFTAADLRRKGLATSFAYLAQSEDEREVPEALTKLLVAMGDDARGAELSVKPSSLGLRTSPSSAREQLLELCARADATGALVTLEMQGWRDYRPTLDLYCAVRRDFPLLGVTLPVNFHAVREDIHRLAHDGARLRVTIGSYPAPRGVQARSEHDKSLALAGALRELMASDAYPMVASHDARIIAITQELAERNRKGPDDFEFQMLMGVRPLEQRRLVDIGLRCRTYVPFGPAWYEYLATRIAARPRTLWSYARAVLDKR